MSDYNQWSTVRPYLNPQSLGWVPKEDRDRLAAYEKYDQMYWNDGRQYPLRVLEGEEPLYIPNARIVVDTTAYFLLKGLKLTCQVKATQDKLDEFLKREAFYSRFTTAKHSGVARGDFVFHLTANPRKPKTKRLSLNSVHPGNVFPIYDEDYPEKMTGCDIAVEYYTSDDPDKTRVRVLKYRLEETDTTRRVSREEAVYELEPTWYGKKPEKVKQLIPFGYLSDEITAIPIYWFKNRYWDGEDFGSSELRGLEAMAETVSQGSTDVSASLALEGLGVYATDGGRPVSDDGEETDWEVSPGKVMEVPTGSYFRRVEGVGSITPATDQIDYLEKKMYKAAGLSDVSIGDVDAVTAASGIALAIHFMPTLAKIDTRDEHGKDILTQLFYDWKTWYGVFEQEALDGDIVPVIGDKLPTDRVAKVNELNNMMDRHVISAKYYRSEMEALGYKFPTDIETDIRADFELLNPPQPNAGTDPNADPNKDLPENPGSGSSTGSTLPDKNRSNNASRTNESKGTEAK